MKSYSIILSVIAFSFVLSTAQAQQMEQNSTAKRQNLALNILPTATQIGNPIEFLVEEYTSKTVIRIHDMNGSLIAQEQTTNSGENAHLVLQTYSLSPGIYIVHAESNGKAAIGKFILTN